jgi:glycosyltransferase involved in cell wall biosynthesis
MHTEGKERPLVTFLLLAYNQERFIREAVAGAFAQTYSPLEIILSDDCSPDQTFEIMQEMAEAYRGPHQIHVNRAPANRGISAQIDAAVKLAKGEWIVVAAGDDISLPNRVADHIAIANANPDAYSSFLAPLPFGGTASNRVPVVVNQVIRFPKSLKVYGGGILGATHAFRASLWNVFGDLGSGIISEDWVIPFRSSLLGSVVWSDRPGVRYRVHDNSVTAHFWGTPGKFLQRGRLIRMESNALEAFQRDLEKAIILGLVPKVDGQNGVQWLKHALTTNGVILDCVEANNLGNWIPAAIKLLLCRQFIGTYGRRINLLQQTFKAVIFRGTEDDIKKQKT